MYEVKIEKLLLQNLKDVSGDNENVVGEEVWDSEGGDGELGLVESGSRDRYTASDWSALSRPRRRRQAGGRSRRQGLGLLPTEEENGELFTGSFLWLLFVFTLGHYCYAPYNLYYKEHWVIESDGSV